MSRHSYFDVYRADRVSFTSVLSGGDDWHWRLVSSNGDIMGDCGGFASRSDCLKAIDFLRAEAGGALMPAPCGEMSVERSASHGNSGS